MNSLTKHTSTELSIDDAGSRHLKRPDIQHLRGVSVILVILYHSNVYIARSGYLGVDAFFAISGFLITGIIYREGVSRTFSLQEFYLKRIRRLWPSLYFTITITAVLGAFLLTQSEFSSLFGELFGTLTFVNNVVIWRQTGYFHPSSVFDPFLHTWSLSIEEQYYCVIPILMILIRFRRSYVVLLSLTVFSGVCYVALSRYSASAAFFLLPSRAWEFGFGSLASFCVLTGRLGVIRMKARIIAWTIVLFLPILRLSPAEADLSRLAIVSATCFLLVTPSLKKAPRWSSPLEHVGNLSYALYLIHWPLFSLAHCVYLSAELPTLIRSGIILATFVLAEVVTRYIETPIRQIRMRNSRQLVASVVASAAVLSIGFAGYAANSIFARTRIVQEQHGVAGLPIPGCFTEDGIQFKGDCTQTSTPEVLVWGDSFAAHIVPGLLASDVPAMAQASKGQCGPFANFAFLAQPSELRWTIGCLSYNESVLNYIAAHLSIKVVVLSARYSRYVEKAMEFVSNDQGVIREMAGGQTDVVDAFALTVHQIRALHRRVVVVSPPPQASFEVAKCYERRDAGLLVLGQFKSCEIQGSGFDPRSSATTSLIMDMSKAADVPVIWLDASLCQHGECKTEIESTPLYRDRSHLSAAGSAALGRSVGLGRQIWSLAR